MIIPLARCMQEACKDLLFYHHGFFPEITRLDGVSHNDGEEPYSVTFQVTVRDQRSTTYTVTIVETESR